MKEIIKKVLKVVSAILTIALLALVAVIVMAINPWNMPAIFKRNYPQWFAAHPFISSLIKVD